MPGGRPTACAYRIGGWFDSIRARRIARRLARVSLRRRVRFETGPAYCPTARPWPFGGGYETCPASCPTARSRRFSGGYETCPASCPTARSYRFGGWCDACQAACQTAGVYRFGSADRLTLRRLPNGSLDNCLTGKIRYGIRSHTHQPRWAWAQAQSHSSWSVLTISRLMPAPRISLNEVITGPSEVEGLSGSMARPFYLSA